jgi:DNA-binding NarL/FixJ family response regulator
VSVPFRGKHRQDWPLGEFWDLTAVFRLKDSLHDEIPQLIKEVRSGGAPMTPSIARFLLKQMQREVASKVGAALGQKQLSGEPMLPTRSSRGAARPIEVTRAYQGSRDDEPLIRLTPAESNVLQMLARGMKTNEIAEHHHLSVHTVRSHVKSIYSKLYVSGRGEAVFKASMLGLLNPDSVINVSRV